jgi:hypothetical protein
LPDIEVFHAVSSAARNWSRIRFYEHRNDVLRELLRCPTALLGFRLIRTWLSHTRYNLSTGEWLTDFRVAAALPWILATARRLRAPVSKAAYRGWAGLG